MRNVSNERIRELQARFIDLNRTMEDAPGEVQETRLDLLALMDEVLNTRAQVDRKTPYSILKPRTEMEIELGLAAGSEAGR